MRTVSGLLCRLLIVSVALLPFSVQAGMIGTDQVAAGATAQTNRDKVRDFVARADIASQLEALGLSAATAQERVNAMTQDEINRVTGKIDSMPAGASDSGTAWVLASLIVIAVLVYVFWK